jgi:5-methyltetrahydrofolate--homocysteine methyltransferase
VVLNSVFLHECQKAGLSSAIVHASKIVPMNRIPDEQRECALDLVYDRRREGYDPLTALLAMFEGVEADTGGKSRNELLMELPLDERLQRRIIDGEKNGLEADLDEAMAAGTAPLAIVNDTLLSGMKVVGELFGSGEMQLPFVLQSAEVMKTSSRTWRRSRARTARAGSCWRRSRATSTTSARTSSTSSSPTTATRW